jgi:predicted kinase
MLQMVDYVNQKMENTTEEEHVILLYSHSRPSKIASYAIHNQVQKNNLDFRA